MTTQVIQEIDQSITSSKNYKEEYEKQLIELTLAKKEIAELNEDLLTQVRLKIQYAAQFEKLLEIIVDYHKHLPYPRTFGDKIVDGIRHIFGTTVYRQDVISLIKRYIDLQK